MVSALWGTAVGLLIGAGIVIAAGTNEGVLWALLPVAVLVAAYAPQAISFATGQAGFTVVVLDPLQHHPANRVDGRTRPNRGRCHRFCREPRGRRAVLAPRGGGAHATQSRHQLRPQRGLRGCRRPGAARRGGCHSRARQRARAAADRLDDAFRQYLGELSRDHAKLEDIATLLTGATRLRLAGYSLSTLGGLSGASSLRESCIDVLEAEVRRLHSWYMALGEAVADGRPPPPADDADPEGRLRILRCARESGAREDEAGARLAVDLLLAAQHLDNLRRLEFQLVDPAAELAGQPPEKRTSYPGRGVYASLGEHAAVPLPAVKQLSQRIPWRKP